MIYSKLFNLMKKIEKDLPVSEWVVSDIHVWPVIKIQARLYVNYYDNIQSANKGSSTAQPSADYKELEWLFDRNLLARKTDVVFLSHAGVRANVEGIWYDKFCDHLIEELGDMGKSALMLEYTGSGKYNYPVYIPSARIGDEVNYYVNANFDKDAQMSYNLKGFDEFTSRLSNFFKSEGYNPPAITLGWIIQRVKVIRLAADYFKMIFARTRPEMGITICFYTDIGYGFNLACREYGILSVDVLHGAYSTLDCTFGGWTNVPDKGYGLLPGTIWVWNKDDKVEIEKWTAKYPGYHSVINGGNPWLKMWEKLSGNIKPLYDAKFVGDGSTVNILYTHSNAQGIEKCVIGAIERCPKNWRWWIRFHPMEKKEEILRLKTLLDNLSNKNINHDIPNGMPLLALLYYMDVHVTTMSSCVIEAEYFNVPSVVTNEFATVTYFKQVQSGMVLAAYDDDELIGAVKAQLNKKNSLSGKYGELSNSSKMELEDLFARAKSYSTNMESSMQSNEYREWPKELDLYGKLSNIRIMTRYRSYDGLLKLCDVVMAEIGEQVFYDDRPELLNYENTQGYKLKRGLLYLINKYEDVKIELTNYLLNTNIGRDDLEGNLFYKTLAGTMLLNAVRETGVTGKKPDIIYNDIFHLYIKAGIGFVKQLYRLDKLKLSYRTIESREHRFLIAVSYFFEAADKNNRELAVRYLEEAGQAYPFMAGYLALLRDN